LIGHYFDINKLGINVLNLEDVWHPF
jgi:hypothetical protein